RNSALRREAFAQHLNGGRDNFYWRDRLGCFRLTRCGRDRQLFRDGLERGWRRRGRRSGVRYDGFRRSLRRRVDDDRLFFAATTHEKEQDERREESHSCLAQ